MNTAKQLQGRQNRPSVSSKEQLQLITLYDLIEFKNEILLEMKKAVKESIGQPSKKWLKTKEVCKMLGVSITTLLTLRINGILPYTKMGGVLYFDYEDILKVMENNKCNHHAGA